VLGPSRKLGMPGRATNQSFSSRSVPDLVRQRSRSRVKKPVDAKSQAMARPGQESGCLVGTADADVPRSLLDPWYR
jgi:hypothetical protein